MTNTPVIWQFDIKPYDRDAVYLAVGKIIENAQFWEKEYRECIKLFGIEMNNVDRKTLVKINQKLKKEGVISEEDYKNLSKIITYKNEINHSLFIDIMEKCNSEQDWYVLEKYLNMVMVLIFEARDMVENILNKFNPNHIHIQTVFD